jgi:hypothetical protein
MDLAEKLVMNRGAYEGRVLTLKHVIIHVKHLDCINLDFQFIFDENNYHPWKCKLTLSIR